MNKTHTVLIVGFLLMASASHGFMMSKSVEMCDRDPSLLAHIGERAISMRFGVSDLDYKRIERDDTLYSSTQSAGVDPELVVLFLVQRIGVSVGFDYLFLANTDIDVFKNVSDYMVNERRFTSRTNMALDYRAIRQSRLSLGAGGSFGMFDLGARLTLLRQIAKEGVINSEIVLSAEHGEEINPNDPRQLIPAIADGLQNEIVRQDLPRRDETGTGFDFDFALGFRIWSKYGARPVVVFRSLFVPQMPFPLHSGLLAYCAWQPRDWIEMTVGSEKLLSEKPRFWITGTLQHRVRGVGGVFGIELEKCPDGLKSRLDLALLLGQSSFGISTSVETRFPSVVIYQEHRF